jgi:hypothetical protein
MADKGIQNIVDEFVSKDPAKVEEQIQKQADESAKKSAEETTQKVVEQTKVESKQETKKAPVEEVKTEFDWSKINQLMGRDEESAFKTEEDFKTFFEEVSGKAGKTAEYEKILEERKAKDEEYQTLMDYIQQNEGKYDPLNSVFKGDKEAMKRYFVAESLKQNGYNKSVVDRVMGADLDQMDSMDVIILGRQLKSKRLIGKDESIKRNVLREVGVDVDNEEFNIRDMKLTSDQQADLDAEADEVASEIRRAIDSVQIPETADPIKKILETTKTRKESQQQLHEAWTGQEATDKLKEKLDILKFEHEGYEFKYKMSDAEKTSLLKEIALDAAIQGKEVNEENLKLYSEAAKQRFASRNLGKLFSAAAKQIQLKSKEQIEKDVYSGKKADIAREKPGEATTSHPFEEGLNKVIGGRDVKSL